MDDGQRRPCNFKILFQLTSAYLNKFHAIKTEYGGIRYDSKAEAIYARNLDVRMHAQGRERVASWERQIRFPLVVNGTTVGHMVVDFKVCYADGREELVEIKSVATMTPLFRFKLKLLRILYPELIYTIQQ